MPGSPFHACAELREFTFAAAPAVGPQSRPSFATGQWDMVAKSLIACGFCRIVLIRALMRRNLALAAAFQGMISVMIGRSQRSALLALALLSTTGTAYGQCISPSTEAGNTQTTVYRCPDESPAVVKQPLIVN